MKDRDITAEGLLGCTYDEYDRYPVPAPVPVPVPVPVPLQMADLACIQLQEARKERGMALSQ